MERPGTYTPVPSFKEAPSHDLFRPHPQPLDAIFKPRAVAVIGASEQEGTVGRTILKNLLNDPFGATVYPVNPKRPSVLGIKAYASVSEIPEAVDLAVIATPARTVPGIIRECVEKGIKGAVIISAGFKEIGEAGVKLEQDVLEIARAGKMRIIGPNCLGVMRPPTGMNATFATGLARPGNVALLSQSGAILTAILDWSFREHVGFSAFVSVGSMLDVGWGDLISYFGNDPKTESILIYMETIGDARSFLSAAREVAFQKPIIVIKAGRTEQAAQAAASHTGSLAGSDEVLSAAFRRSGVLRVDAIADLFQMAETLAKQPRPRGRNLTILTNAGGPGVLATDALIKGGGKLTPISEEAMTGFNDILPAAWSHGNPVDILGDASPERYARSLEIAANDAHSDGLLVVLTPQGMTDPAEVARELVPYAQQVKKPVLASWMGGETVLRAQEVLNTAGVPTFAYPDTAARIFNYMWQYNYNLQALYETPTLPDHLDEGDYADRAAQIIAEAREAGRTLLTEAESKALLATYGIPTTEMYVAETVEEAVSQAEKIGYPVVLKLHSYTVTHKTDVGGVKLNLRTEEAVRQAFGEIKAGVEAKHPDGFDGVSVQPMVRLEGYELIIGSSLDVQFGPVLLFGSGGSLVEVYKDRALGLPPLTTTLARRMMEQTTIYEALHGVRGRDPVDLEALEELMVRFSQLVVEQRFIKEIDINPLLASPERLLVLDARVVLYDPDVEPADLQKLAIRPYPRQYVGTHTLADGTPVTIRPIRPEDEPLVVDFHKTLSERSVYLRYAGQIDYSQRVAHSRLARLCFIDYDREMALVAEHQDAETGEPKIIGIGRLTTLPGTKDGEFALLIPDEIQGEGLGTELLRRLVQVGQDAGLERIMADILMQNGAMQHVARKLGFHIVRDGDDTLVKAIYLLGQEAPGGERT